MSLVCLFPKTLLRFREWFLEGPIQSLASELRKKKKRPYFPLNPGCLIRILTMIYQKNPHKNWDVSHPQQIPQTMTTSSLVFHWTPVFCWRCFFPNFGWNSTDLIGHHFALVTKAAVLSGRLFSETNPRGRGLSVEPLSLVRVFNKGAL